jgi:hypothetical protein
MKSLPLTSQALDHPADTSGGQLLPRTGRRPEGSLENEDIFPKNLGKTGQGALSHATVPLDSLITGSVPTSW